MTVKKQSEKEIAKERLLRLAGEEEILKYRDKCTTYEKEIEIMQGLLRKHGIENPTKQVPHLNVRGIVDEATHEALSHT